MRSQMYTRSHLPAFSIFFSFSWYAVCIYTSCIKNSLLLLCWYCLSFPSKKLIRLQLGILK